MVILPILNFCMLLLQSYRNHIKIIPLQIIIVRHAGDNTRRTIDLIDLLNKTNRAALILSLDAQKAFKRLSWPLMFAMLS